MKPMIRAALVLLAFGLVVGVFNLGSSGSRANAVTVAYCVDQANQYIDNMIKPSPGDPNAMGKCQILLDKCLSLCTCPNKFDRAACQLACHGNYDYPTHCP